MRRTVVIGLAMYLIYTFSTLFFIWIVIGGITVIGNKYIEDVAIARSTGLLSVVLVLFFVEHFIGLGKLFWAFPVVLIAGGWLIWKERIGIGFNKYWQDELVFVFAFLYGFFWRYSFPNISPSSEKITDLFFIGNYYSGDTLPPVDNWNPPHLFDYYYAFQHYAAALLGRVFNLDIGLCYNLSFALLAALPLTLLWSLSGQYIKRSGYRIFLVCTLALGGTGLSPILHIAYMSPSHPTNNDEMMHKQYAHVMENFSYEMIVSSMRYIGGSMDSDRAADKHVIEPIADIFLPITDQSDKNPRQVLPLENYGYQFFLGDYHPTLGGFFILLLTIALLFHIENNKQQRLSQGILGLLAPVMLITNTWTFPLLILLLLGWVIYRITSKKTIDWIALIIGAVSGTFLIYPFLIGFTDNSLTTPIKLVNSGMHTPVSRFVAMHWPVLLLLTLGFFSEKRTRRLSIALCMTWLLLLLMSEFIFIDDPTTKQYERTNSVMKWWGWIQTGIVASLGTLYLGSSKKIVRWATVIIFMLINVIAVDLARYWYYSVQYDRGKLTGHHWYTRDTTNRMMFDYLKQSPRGVILESIVGNAYTNTGIYGAFNDKPILLGWPLHLSTWHGNSPRVWIQKEEIDAFYRGEKKDALKWLASNDVKYIVFRPTDDNTKFEVMNNLIKNEYQWHEYNHSRNRHIGIWVRLRE